MFAFAPVLTALLALSGVHHAHAKGTKEDFTVEIEFNFDNASGGMLTGPDKKIIADAMVDSFNSVHNTEVIELYTFKFTPKSFVNQGTSYLSHLLPAALTTGLGGNYGGYGGGTGGNCRACLNDDMLEETNLAYTHHKWEKAFTDILKAKGVSAANAVIKIDGESYSLSTESVRDPKKEDFSMDISFSFDDPKSGDITDADEGIICDCVVSSFNGVHDPEVIEMYTFEMTKFEVSRASGLSLLRGNDTPSVGVGGNYGGYGSGTGGNCRACLNDDMLTADVLAYTHKKWQKAFTDCLDSSGSDALAGAKNSAIKIVGTDGAAFE